MGKFPQEFYLVTVLATLVFTASTIITPFFSLFLNEKGASPIELGLIVSVMSYTTLVTRMPFGIVTGRFGIKWVVPFALIGQSVSYILYSLVDNLAFFYPIRIFHAISLASLNPTLMSIASTIAPEDKKGEAIGIYLTSVGVAMMFGPFLCSLLLSYFDYGTILLLSSILPSIAFVFYIGLLKTNISANISIFSRRETLRESSLKRLREVISIRSVQMLGYVRFTFAFTMSIIATLYAVYAVNTLKVDPSIYALLITIRGLANTFSRIPAGRISDVIGRKKPLLFSFITLTTVFFLFSEVKDPIFIGITMLLYGMAHGIRAVSEWSLLADVVPSNSRNLANFLLPSVFELGSALGATFSGLAAMIIPVPEIMKIVTLLIGTSVLVIAITKIPQIKMRPQE